MLEQVVKSAHRSFVEVMPFIEASKSRTKEDDVIDTNLQRVNGNGYIQIPSSSQLLERLYNNHGVRVRMIRRSRPKKIPTVRELIDHLAKKHEKLLEMEGKGAKIETRSPSERSRVSLDSPSVTDLGDSGLGKNLKNDGVSDLIGPKLNVFPGRVKRNSDRTDSKWRLDPLLGSETERRVSLTERLGDRDEDLDSQTW